MHATALRSILLCSVCHAGGAGASAASAGRPATTLGIEAASPEEFTCWSEPSSPGAATLGSRLGDPAGSSGSAGSAGSGASKRLSFSFGMPAPTLPKEQPTVRAGASWGGGYLLALIRLSQHTHVLS